MIAALRAKGARWAVVVHALDYAIEFASMVVLMALVYQATERPVLVAAMLLCKQVLPGLLLAVLGPLLDRIDLRTGLTASALMRVTTLGALAALGYGWWVLPLSFLLGLAGVSSRVLVRTAVARVAHGSLYRDLTALLNVNFGVVSLAGPALGALVVGWLGAIDGLLLSALATGALLAAALGSPAAARHAELAAPADGEAAADPAASGRGSGRAIPIWSLLALGAVIVGAFAMDEPALLAYSERSLEAGVEGYGVIVTAWGIGMIFGGLIYARVTQLALLRVFVVGVFAAAGGYIGLGLAPSLLWAAAASVLGGLGNGIYWVALVTTVIEHAPAGEEARHAARLEALPTVAPGVGIVLGGLLAEWASPRLTLLVPGLVVLAALLAWLAAIRIFVERRPAAPSTCEVVLS